MSFYVMRLQNCGPSKFAVKKNWKNDIGAFPRLNLSTNEMWSSGGSGLIPGRCSTFGASNFEAL